MSSKQRDSKDLGPSVNVQPPSRTASPAPSVIHTPTSSSGFSIPTHNSENYINSYYYGNVEMPDHVLGASTSRRPSWVPASQSNSPTISPERSRDAGLLRRLSWDSNDGRDNFLGSAAPLAVHPPRARAAETETPGSASRHFHERSGSSADAGLIRGPLDVDLAFEELPEITLSRDFDTHTLSKDFDSYPDPSRSARASSKQTPLYASSVAASTASLPLSHQWVGDSPDEVDDSDRAILTSDHLAQQRHSAHARFAADEAGFARVDSPDELEGGDASIRLKSSADVYATAGVGTGAPLMGTRSGLSRISKSVRRLSRRVVRQNAQQSHVRLEDEHDGSDSDSSSVEARYSARPLGHPPPTFHPPDVLQTLRGKSLGLWGPESRFRKALARLVAQRWVEPFIFLLILANAIILVVQSSRNVYQHPRQRGFFDNTEDYILLGIFCVYTVEILTRIVVSGLIINPPSAIAPLDGGSPEDESPTQQIDKQTEHRRKMSRSNTLDAFADFGGALKGQAQRMVQGSHSTQTPKHSAALSGLNSAYARAKMESTDALGHYPQTSISSGQKPPFPASRTPTRANTAMMLPTSDPAQFWQDKRGPFSSAFVIQRVQAVDHAFLRHSWNRIDLIAVVSFWIAFALASADQEASPTRHLYVFRALSVLRCARLLTVTNGTSVILESLKVAAPILVTVALFTAFAMVLFSIVGIQSFKGSYRRNCVWLGDLAGQPGVNETLSNYCGGYFNSDNRKVAYIQLNGIVADANPKGFLCPVGQVCQEMDSNPEGGTMSFDDIFHSLLEIVIIISSNNWSTTMYDMMDADYYASCLFFIIGLIIMNFWLANLFVAVITNSFATLTAHTNRSAFADQKIKTEPSGPERTGVMAQRMRRVANVYKRIWGWTKYLWLAAIIADLGIQGSRATWMTPRELEVRDKAELYFTIAFDVEILMRFLSFLLDGDWRSFLRSKENTGDFGIAIITSIVQIPAIKDSSVYPWLTFFQVARFYRVIGAVPRMQALLVRVFGSMVGLLNMVTFLLMMVGLAALIAVQLFRGDLPQEDDGEFVEMSFKHIFNSFLAMYQIFTSEDWTTVLFNVLSNETQFKQAIIAGIFLSGWFMFANFIVLQMFIAVINENFSVAEGEKRQQQLEHYLRRNEPPEISTTAKLLQKLSPYRYLRNRHAAKTGSARVPSASGASDDKQKSNAIAGGSTVLDEKTRKRQSLYNFGASSGNRTQRTIDTVKRVLRLDRPEEAVPLDTIRSRRVRQSLSGEEIFQAARSRQSTFFDNDADDQAAKLFATERKLLRMRTDLGLPVEPPYGHHQYGSYPATDANDVRLQQARFIASHPSYDKAYFLFSNHNAFRRFCQSLVPSSYGERMFGRPCSPIRHKVFQAVVFAAIAGSVISAGIATPAYRRDYYAKYGLIRASWFSILEISLSSLFLAEFAVKTIADGFAFTPNAYVLSVWNSLDLLVLITLLINVGTELAVIGGVSRLTRALKAFRALRLINLSSLMRETFHAVMIAGAGRILDASILSILYIIPYAVWGQNLFAGLLYSCSDGSNSIETKFDCFGEYTASSSQWSFLAPRVWANPTNGSVYSFDDFKSSLLILFEIISLEGWIDVMSTAMSVAGRDQQLQNDNRQVNALFFLIYNLVGSTLVLTLFVAVIIENFQQFSGAAFQTAEQRQWIDLKRLIQRQSPSKRPKVRPTASIRSWCYERAVQKTGWWSRGMTAVYLANIIVLMTQQYKDPSWADRVRDIIYLVFTMIYVVDIAVRLLGLGWASFRANPWNLYDLVVVAGTLGTTIPLLKGYSGDQFEIQFQKIFLTCIVFKLVQKSNSFNQLFKTARASLPAILSLFLLWLTMFLVWGIMLLEVFGLTKWGENETYNKNFSTLINSLVFLSMMSTGEGWNSYMHDYTVSPPQCTPAASYLQTDCGSKGWAFFLFITWNVISMYIFLNMFTGTVVENFSYLFQLGGKMMLSREEMRSYKEAWAKFDVERTGYIQPQGLVPFLRSLDGVLEVGLYPPTCSVSNLVAALESNVPLASPVSPSSKSGKSRLERLREVSPLPSPLKGEKGGERGHFMWPQSPVKLEVGSDSQRLKKALAKVDAEELRTRRVRFNRIYHEALLSQHKTKGVSFTKMLLILAHYKLVDSSEALSVEELIQRREMMERVDNQVNLERVRGVMKMVYCRRQYLALRDQRSGGSQLLATPRQGALPKIVVDIETPSVEDEPLSLNESHRHVRSRSGSIASSTATDLSPIRPSIKVTTSSATLVQDQDDGAIAANESFESTAWGGVIRRLSRSEHSVPHLNFGAGPPRTLDVSAFDDEDEDEDEEQEKASLKQSRK